MRALFPTPVTLVIGALALVGLIVARHLRLGYVVVTLAAAVVFTALAHFAVAGRFPYPRNMGLLLPLILLAAGALLEWIYLRAESGARRSLVVLAAVGLTGWVVWSASEPRVVSAQFASFVRTAGVVPAEANTMTIPILDPRVDESAEFYFPSAWLDKYAALPAAIPLRVCTFTRESPDGIWAMSLTRSNRPFAWDTSTWANRYETTVADTYHIACIAGRTLDVTAPPASERALVFWSMRPSTVAVSAERVEQFLRTAAIPYKTVTHLHQVKLDVYGRLFTVILVADTAAERDRILTLVPNALERFGGSATVFYPNI